MPTLIALVATILVLWLPSTFSDAAQPNNRDVLARYFANPEQVGSGRLRFLLWDVYDAALYAPAGKWREDDPYAIALTYLREASGEDITQRSVEQIRRQGFDNDGRLADWRARMIEIFPDVSAGDLVLCIRDADLNSVFYHNGVRVGTVHDSEFTEHFFAIWLDKKTRIPELRKKLLGLEE